MPAIDLADDTFVVVDRHVLASRFADQSVQREWWPRLVLTAFMDRGPDGIRWSVTGELRGSAEIWLEPWRDGVIVHWYLRADPAQPVRHPDRLRRSYSLDYKSRIHALKDSLEADRPPGASRPGAGR